MGFSIPFTIMLGSPSPSHCTAYDHAGLSFEEFLANRLGVTVTGLLTIFENFVGSSFGREYSVTGLIC